MDNNTLYDTFINETQRLKFNEPLQRIAIDYVYKQISDTDAIRLFNRGLPDFDIVVLKHIEIYEATAKALYVMINSKDKAEFNRKIQKYIAKNEVVDFDEILNKLLKNKP